ncbi:MAG: hypothetical protein ACFNLO_03190 [Selenomonas massiliensis]
MEYLAKFNAMGHYVTAVVSGVHFKTDNERQKYLDDGYIAINNEDYQLYIGNRGGGDYGMGYIRDPITGSPVSATLMPPISPISENEDSSISAGLMDIAEIILDMSDAIRLLEQGGEKA